MIRFVIDIQKGFLRIGHSLRYNPEVHPLPGSGNIANCEKVHLISTAHPKCFKLLERYLTFTKPSRILVENIFEGEQIPFDSARSRPGPEQVKIESALKLVEALAQSSVRKITFSTRSPLILLSLIHI